MKIFLKKEIKSTEIGKTVLVMILLTAMLGVLFIGEIGKLEKKYELDIDGLLPLIVRLLNSPYSVTELIRLIINIGFTASLMVYTVYIGIPYILSSFERSKADGTLLHIMIMPIKVRSLVLKFALFGFGKTLVMTLFTFSILFLPIFIIKPSVITNLPIFLTPFEAATVTLLSIIIVTYLLWIFNGSKFVITFYRWSILGMLVIIMPLIKHIGLGFEFPNGIIVVIILLLMFITAVCFLLIDKCFNKEKIVLLFTK